MKRFLLSLIAGSSLLLSSADCMAQSTIGYTTGKMAKGTICRSGSTEKQGLAIKLSHDKLQPLAGKSINSVKLAFGSRNTEGKVANLFIATSLDDAPLYTQEMSITKANAWLTESLTQPYTITGEEEALYIGYTAQIPTTYNLLQADHTNELRDCSFAWTNGEWTDLYGTGYGSANIYIGLNQDVSFTDVIVAEIDLANNFYIAGNAYQHTSHLFNFGTQPVTSIDVVMQIDGQQSTRTITGLDIPQYGSYEFDLPELNTIESGNIDLQVSVMANDANESDLADNTFASTAFFYPANIERSILVEEFTGQTCPNCPAGKRTLDQAIEQSGLPCVEIMHHSGYSADNFTTEADGEYTWFYGSNSTYAPAAMFNRLTNPAVGDVPVINIGLNDCLKSLDYANQLQPYASLGLSTTFDEATGAGEATFKLLAHNNFPNAVILNMFLVQDSIIGNQSNGGTDYVHNGVLRDVITGSIWGLLLPDTFTAGESMEYTAHFEVPESIYSDYYSPAHYNADYDIPTDPAHMRIVAYIASYDTQDLFKNMVYNSIEVPLINGSYTQSGMTSALEEITADSSASHLGTFDLSGRHIDNKSTLAPGLYIVNGQKILIK